MKSLQRSLGAVAESFTTNDLDVILEFLKQSARAVRNEADSIR